MSERSRHSPSGTSVCSVPLWFPFLPRAPADGFGRLRSHLLPPRGCGSLPPKPPPAAGQAWRHQSPPLSWQGPGLLPSSLWLLGTYVTHSQDFIFQQIESKATVDFLQKRSIWKCNCLELHGGARGQTLL